MNPNPNELAEWRWLTFQDGADSHMVQGSQLAHVIREDLETRGATFRADEPTGGALTLDRPGMICTARPQEEFLLAGLRVVIPAEDVAVFADMARTAQVRPSPAGEYVKLHGFLRCLCITPATREAFVHALEDRSDVAEATAAAFYRGRETPQEILRRVQPHALPEVFGPDRLGRLRRRGNA